MGSMTAPISGKAVTRSARRARARALERVREDLPAPDFGKAETHQFDPWGTGGLAYNAFDGLLSDGSDARAREMNEMLEVWGKARQLDSVLSLPARSATWHLVAGKGERSGVATKLEELLRAPVHESGMQTPIDLVVGQLSSARIYRRAYFEKELTPTPDDRMVTYRGLWFCPPETCQPLFTKPDPTTGRVEFDGFRQERFNVVGTNADDFITVRAHRAFVYTHGKHRQPLRGVSDFDVALWAYRLSVKVSVLWLDYLGAMALPRTLVWDSDAVNGRKTARKINTLRNSGTAFVGAKSPTNAVDVLDMAGKGSGEFVQMLKWCEATALDSNLAGFTGMASGAAGDGAGGAFALSKDASDFFLMAQQAELREQAADLTAYVVGDLARHNFGPGVVVPRWQFDPLEQEDVAPTLDMVKTLAAVPSFAPGFPMEFLGEAVTKTAKYLNMDETYVQEAVDYAMDKAREKAAAAGVDGAAPGMDVAAATGAVNALGGMVGAAGGSPQEQPQGGPQ